MISVIEVLFYFVISTLVGLFGLHLLIKKGPLASKFLGLYFLVFCLRIMASYFATNGRILEFPHLYLVASPIHFLGAPISFLFVYFMLFPARKFRVWQALLFVPFVLHAAELMPFYFGPIENKIKEINLVLKYKSLVNYPGSVTFFSPSVLTTIKVCLTTGYAIVSFYIVLNFILKNKVQYKSNQFIFIWLMSFVVLSLLSIFFIIAYVTGRIGFNNLTFSYTDLLMQLSAYVNIFCVLYRPSLLDGVTFNSLVFRLHENDRQAEPGEDVEKLKKYEAYAKRLESYFANEKPFLDPELTLEKTANKLQISAKELSRATSYIYELGYPDFVNSWRINYIVEQRNSDKKWKAYSQDVLAELSGFGSRQGLHNAVNRLHGTTPLAFFSGKTNKN